MDALALGPFVLSYERLTLLGALALLLLGGELANRRHAGLASWSWWTVVVGALSSRLIFAASTPQAYLSAPWTLLYFWQPGYSLWGALLGALAFTLWYWRQPTQRMPLTWAVSLLVASGLLLLMLQQVLPRTPVTADPLPELTFNQLDGTPFNLAAQQGQPIVVNLWATWCPPCRREMPVLAEYDQDPRVQVILINQGESLLGVQRYLDQAQLEFQFLLLDPRQEAMAFYGAPGLPATLFYNAEGELVDRHFGELSRAQLERFAREFSAP